MFVPKRSKPIVMAIAIVTALGLMSSVAMGGGWPSAGNAADDVGNNTPPFIASDAHSWPNTSCDTIDPITTAERSKVAYKCIAVPPNPAPGAVNGYLNLTEARIETIDSHATPNGAVPFGYAGNNLQQKLNGEANPAVDVPGRDTIKMTFKSQGPIPAVCNQTSDPNCTQVTEELLTAALGGFVFSFAFQVPAKMNKRQIIGDTIDCNRYAHMGPWFAGDRLFWSLQYQITIEHGVIRHELFQLLTDPGGFPFGGFLIQADPPDTLAATRSCTQGPSPQPPSQIDTAFEGTRWAMTRPSATDLVVYVPMKFRWVDNQRNPYTMTLMSEGDSVQSVTAIALGTVNTASTPTITVGPVHQGGQGLQGQTTLDWLPWSGFRLGNLTDASQGPPGGLFPFAAILGPTCPHYWAAEFVSGGGRHNTGGTYLNLGKGPGTPPTDRDTQSNPLYGLGSYDGSGESGTGHGQNGGAPFNDTPVLGTQNHAGATSCYIHMPDQGGNVPDSSRSFSA